MVLEDGAQMITITTTAEGEHLAHLPLPHKVLLSPALLGLLCGQLFETVITMSFANGAASYKVIGVNAVGVLVCERIDEGGA